MLWFYVRDTESMRLETRFDNQTLEYVGIVTHPDGHTDTRRFPSATTFRLWLVWLDASLLADQWAQDGAPQILRDGWPDKRPAQ
jgi:hypothetical protein